MQISDRPGRPPFVHVIGIRTRGAAACAALDGRNGRFPGRLGGTISSQRIRLLILIVGGSFGRGVYYSVCK